MKAKFRLQRNNLRLIALNNTLVVAKICKESLEKKQWFVHVLNEPHNLPNGVVSVLLYGLLLY